MTTLKAFALAMSLMLMALALNTPNYSSLLALVN